MRLSWASALEEKQKIIDGLRVVVQNGGRLSAFETLMNVMSRWRMVAVARLLRVWLLNLRTLVAGKPPLRNTRTILQQTASHEALVQRQVAFAPSEQELQQMEEVARLTSQLKEDRKRTLASVEQVAARSWNRLPGS